MNVIVSIMQADQPIQRMVVSANGGIYGCIVQADRRTMLDPKTVSVGIAVTPAPITEPGDGLVVWSDTTIRIKPVWQDCLIPSRRPLWAIVSDVVAHGVEYPTHGTGCSCMDRFSWEIKAHLYRSLPTTQAGAHLAKARINYIFGMVSRSL